MHPKFRPSINQLSRWSALALILACLLSCGETPPVAVPVVDATSASWDEQLALVRKGDSTEIRVHGPPVTSQQWQQLGEGCENLQVLDVERFDTDGPDLSLLQKLPGLMQLVLGAPVDDAGLKTIATLSTLKVLNLPRGTFSDQGLQSLAHLPQLELLRIGSPHVTNEGLRTIAQLPALRFLHLIGIPITDEGLPHLYPMTRLESFYLDGSSCSDEGLSRLIETLPHLHFHRDQLHLPDDPHSHE